MSNGGQASAPARKTDPSAIAVPQGFKVSVFAEGLTTPINLILTDDGEMLVADAGITSGSGKVLKRINNRFEVFAEGFIPPLTGITAYQGDIYVTHRGHVTAIKPDGTKVDILSGLPSYGDHHNNRVVFGQDGKMYFGQGTATNSGVVGPDNEEWVKNYPFFHDYPGSTLQLVGYNFVSQNFLSQSPQDIAYTGAYAPYGVPSAPSEIVKGVVKASGSVLRANPDGSNLELVAWGLRNPFRMKFDRYNRLFSTNHGMDVRGSRPVANSPDELLLIQPGAWYGWPDYTGGFPVTLPDFRPQGLPQPMFILAYHPMNPPMPLVNFTPHCAIMGFDFNPYPEFGSRDDIYIAEFGSEAPETTGGLPLPQVGHRVSRIDMQNMTVNTFAINKSSFAASYTNEGGLERPIDVLFGPNNELYVVDFGMTSGEEEDYLPGTGVIWVITREGS
ncbi:MAG: PQQ-dependent sugar dehydrogenase [Clostridia bacterium]|nr:PQQ-dependent sugar dehydrogenase [Clostridia bacterium]